jgi:hypothetical protein
MTKYYKVVSPDPSIPDTTWETVAEALVEATRIAEDHIGMEVWVLGLMWKVIRVAEPE